MLLVESKVDDDTNYLLVFFKLCNINQHDFRLYF